MTTAPHFPRLPLAAAGAMVVASVLVVTFVQLTGVGAVRTVEAPTVAVQELRFEDQADGSITVMAAEPRRVLDVIEPGTNGFLRGTMRGLARERHRRGLGEAMPFRMLGQADGRLILEDPATGRRVDLGSFGPANAAVFARIMDDAMRSSGPIHSSRTTP